jgi:thiamine kinase-like enzyme
MAVSDLDSVTTVEAIEATYLTALLREGGYTGVEIATFYYTPLEGKSHGGGSLYRFHLELTPATPETVPKTLILKETETVPSQSQDRGYAHREAECYQMNLFAGLGQRLLVPRAYYIQFLETEERFWIWMEDYGQAFDLAWTPEILIQAVRDLAELHAVWWERREEWSRLPFLRQRAQAMYDGLWTERIAKNLAAIAGHPHETAITRVFTPERQQYLRRLSQAADWVYPYLERLPQTLLHHDVWLPNMGRRGDQTVLIDWSYIGPGTPGADLSQSYALLVQMWGHDVDDTPLLEALYTGLVEDWQRPISYDQVVAGYELTFCLRPAQALAGPVLGGILSGRQLMVGSNDLEERLAAAETVLQRIERGLRRLAEA